MLVKKLSVRTKLVLVSALVVAVAMGLLATANLYSAQKTSRDLVATQTMALMSSNVREIQSWANERVQILQSLKPAALAADPIPFLAQAQESGGFISAYIGGADKSMQTDKPANLPPGYDPTSRPWYQQASSSGKAILTEPYEDAAANGLVLTVAIPIQESGVTKAVIAGDIALKYVVASTQELKPTEHSFAYLVSQKGQVVAHPDATMTMKDVKSVFPDYDIARLKDLAGTQGSLADARNAAGEFWLGAKAIPDTDWLLVVALSQDDVLAGVRQMRWQALITSLVMIALAAILLAFFTRALLRRLGRLRDALQNISSGEADLTQRLDQSGHDELAQVAQAFNTFIEKIAQTLRSIRSTTESVHLASDEIASGNADLARRTEAAAASLQETSSSIEELASTVKQTADSGSVADNLASNTTKAALSGGELMHQVVGTMQAINENAARIGDIVSVIDGIAFQTNILALNAAVEAARAGEHGSGFAVVASEVRSLAQRSAQSAREIKELIETNVQQVERGGTQVRQAGEAMEGIVTEVRRVTDIIGEIKTATNEQSLGLAQIEVAVQQLDGATQQNAALVQESAAAADSLRDQAQTLARIVAGFKLDEHPAAASGAPGRLLLK